MKIIAIVILTVLLSGCIAEDSDKKHRATLFTGGIALGALCGMKAEKKHLETAEEFKIDIERCANDMTDGNLHELLHVNGVSIF